MRLSARLASVAGRLPVAAADSRRRWLEREALLLKVDDGEGHVGQGEAAPLPGYSPDALEQARAALDVVAWDRLDVRDPEFVSVALPRALQSIEASCPSARAALEIALLDLIAQRRGEPLHGLLRAGPRGRAVGPIPLAALLPMPDASEGASGDEAALEAALAFAEARAGEGIRVFKAKVGADLDRELAFLGRFRARCPAPHALRLDANQSLAGRDAPRALARLAELGPEYLEEPLPLDELFRLGGPPPLPIALDESLQRADVDALAERALDEGRVRAFVLKPGALGGLTRCLELAAMAASRGAPSSVSHLHDGPVALAAAAELALALDLPAAAGLAPHPGLGLWPPAPSPAFEGARIEPHQAPGLGLPELSVSR